MNLVIDANMKLFAERMHISPSTMIDEYGLSTIDEIITAETRKGNAHALRYANEYYISPQKLIDLFELTNVENKFAIISEMDDRTRFQILPLLDKEDLVMGLYFFKQDKLLDMLMNVNIVELVLVSLEAFPFEQILQMYNEDDLAIFFLNDNIDKEKVLEQLRILPDEIMKKFVEGVTGRPVEDCEPMELINGLELLPEDEFKKFMALVDPDVQRQLVFQLTQEDPSYMTLFPNVTYVTMLSTLMKPEMVKPLVKLEKETVMQMVSLLPSDLLSIVAAQVDAREFAKFLQDGHMDLIEDSLMI